MCVCVCVCVRVCVCAATKLWALSCERTSHVNIGPSAGLWHRINTLDTEKKGIIRLFNTMELIQPPAKLRWTSFTISGFSLDGDKFRSTVQSGKLAALKKNILKSECQLIQKLFYTLQGTFNKCGKKVKSEPTLCEDDLRRKSRCQKVELSPFSAALIEEMALQPKGTVLQ